MNGTYFTWFGYALSGFLFLLLVTTYFRLQSLKRLLQDAAQRFQRGREAYQKLQADNQAIQEQDLIRKQTVVNLEKGLDEARERLARYKTDAEQSRTQLEQDLQTYALKNDHLQEEHRVLLVQLRDAEQARQLALKELKSSTIEAELKHRAEIEALRSQLADWKGRFAKLERQHQELESSFKKVDPREAHRNKARAKEMETLFQSMKGLREMAEERNQNLEVAARKLAAFLTHKPETLPDGTPAPLGALVGEALEKIGAQLVADGENAFLLDKPSTSAVP